MAGKKVYQKKADGSKSRDKKGFTRYSRDGDKSTYGDNYRPFVPPKKFSK